jgi:osmotically-inducible protein OsmY
VKTLPRAAFIAALAALCACAHQAVQPEDDSDPAIRARIETQIQGRNDLELRQVTIDVYSRVVTVTGVIRDDAQKKILMRLIRRVPGVEQAIENLIVTED